MLGRVLVRSRFRWLEWRNLCFLPVGFRRGEVREGGPVGRRKCNAPEVAGYFELYAYLKQFANAAGPLNPRHATANVARGAVALRLRDFQGDPHIFQDVVL